MPSQTPQKKRKETKRESSLKQRTAWQECQEKEAAYNGAQMRSM